MERAKNLVKLASLAGADYAKFQKRNPRECVPKEMWNQPHPHGDYAYGDTYLKHRQNLELLVEQHAEIQTWCKYVGIGYASSVWDITSAKEIASLNPDFIKVGSPVNLHFELMRYLNNEYKGDIHISLGMITIQEKEDLYQFINDEMDTHRIVLYHCTSEYPCPFEHLYLEEIRKLHSLQFQSSPIGKIRVGFSNHGYGIAADIAAYVLGAEWIERHFVDDRTLKHSDAAASLEPNGLRLVCRDLSAVHKSLTEKSGMTDAEGKQRRKLKYKG